MVDKANLNQTCYTGSGGKQVCHESTPIGSVFVYSVLFIVVLVAAIKKATDTSSRAAAGVGILIAVITMIAATISVLMSG